MEIILFILFLVFLFAGLYFAFPKASFIAAFIFDLLNPPGAGGGGSSTFNKNDLEKRTKKEKMQGLAMLLISVTCLILFFKFV